MKPERLEFKTISDCGGVLIGKDGFQMLIPNGYGDGDTRVIVYEPREFKSCAEDYEEMQGLKFFTLINGTFDIYAEDSAYDDPLHMLATQLYEIRGIFYIFYGCGSVHFFPARGEGWAYRKLEPVAL